MEIKESQIITQSERELKEQLADSVDFRDFRYFGSKPTSVNSESNVRIGESAMPWHNVSEDGKMYKYQYHPHGDKSQPLRAAPSALNTVIVPNVTLPEVCHSLQSPSKLGMVLLHLQEHTLSLRFSCRSA